MKEQILLKRYAECSKHSGMTSKLHTSLMNRLEILNALTSESIKIQEAVLNNNGKDETLFVLSLLAIPNECSSWLDFTHHDRENIYSSTDDTQHIESLIHGYYQSILESMKDDVEDPYSIPIELIESEINKVDCSSVPILELPEIDEQERIVAAIQAYGELDERASKTSDEWFQWSILGGYLASSSRYAVNVFDEHFEPMEEVDLLRNTETESQVICHREYKICHTLIVEDEQTKKYLRRQIITSDEPTTFQWLADHYRKLILEDPFLSNVKQRRVPGTPIAKPHS